MRIVFATVLALAPSPALATDANLDPSFGSYGWTTINSGPGFDQGRGVAIQPDGRIVVAGATTIARYTAAGTLDATFGSGGITNPPGSRNIAAVAIQPDGAIVLAGAADSATPNPKLTVVRLLPAGGLDPTFGSAGVADVDFAPSGLAETVTAVTLQSDGRIVIVGYWNGGPSNINLLAVRLLTDGTLDTSFGTGGIVTIGFAHAAFAQDVAIQADGKIVIGGYKYVPYFTGFVQAFLVVRLDANGALDGTFGTGGLVVNGPRPEGSALGYGVVIQPDGKILLGGHAGFAPHVLRFLPSGSADGAFGVDGIAKTQFDNYDFAPMFDVELRPDGKIVLLGAVSRGGSSVNDTALVRFNADGSLDTTFTATGRARVTIGSRQSAVLDAAQQADGKIVVTGYRADAFELSSESDTEILVARFGGSCGNAFLDAGEQCDDGNTDGLDCCSAGCGWDPAGQICNADASRCTYDTCDGAGTCVGGGPFPGSECKAVTQPLASTLAARDNPVPGRDKISFKWSKGPDTFSYGYPTFATSYSLCVFGGGALASEHEIPSGSGWSSTPKGWKLKRNPQTATPSGIHSARLTMGPVGKSKITVKGKGPLFSSPAIPLATPVTAQLVSSDGHCFGASYATPISNSGSKFKARGQ